MATTSTAVIPNELLTVYAQEAILQAQPNLVFRRFVDYKMQMGLQPGKQIQFLKRSNIVQGGLIPDEFTPVPTQSLNSSIVNVVMREYANSIQNTRLAAEQSFRDLIYDSSLELGRDYARALDILLRDTYLSSANVQYAGGAVSDPTIAAASFLNTAEIKDAVETLRTLNVPPVYRGGRGDYILVVHPHQARTLRDDPQWIDAYKYVTPDMIYAGEAGRFEGVVVIESTQMPILSAVGASGQPLYGAVMFGDRAVAFAESVPFQLMVDPPQDLGRFLRMGWYSIMGSNILNDYICVIHTS